MSGLETDPDVQDLFDAIASCVPRAVAFRGVVIRSAATSYATANDFLFGEGAAAKGGRWNRRGIKAL
jgi:RES domain-containing protein